MNKTTKILILILIVATTAWTRFYQLDRFTTADEKRWLANVSGFTNKLAHGKLDKLVQQPHPGITTQWFSASTVHSESWTIRKLPLVLWQIILLLSTGYILYRLIGIPGALFGTALLATNPMLIAHTRIYAMDSLLAIFALLSLLLVLLWQKTSHPLYLLFAGMSTSAAVLSKTPGATLIPAILAYLIWHHYNTPKQLLKYIFWYLSGGIVGAIIILPSFLYGPMSVIGDFTEFFRSDDYTQLHNLGKAYYAQTILFFTTPLHWLIIATSISLLALAKKAPKKEISLLLGFFFLFIAVMTIGAKKGDRYILPAIIMLDGIGAYVFAWAINQTSSGWNAVHPNLFQHLQSRVALMAGIRRREFRSSETDRRLEPARRHGGGGHQKQDPPTKIKDAVIITIGLLLLWQTIDVIKLTPYTLAYTNPISKHWLGDKRMGWGEGLDISAEYLNKKPNAKNLTVASFYPVEFSYRFQGNTKPAHEWDTNNVDYVVLYRAMLQRGPDSWEKDVLNQFTDKTPEKIIKLGNIEYAWIYKLKE